MKILILSQYYLPESARIAPAVAQGLAAKGHDVKVLTGFPNYPEGKIFPGYKQKWRQHETDGKVSILRVPLYPNHSVNPLGRAANYLSFAFSSLTAWKYAKDVDVIYVYATQMTPALGPWIWRRFGGAPYVLHVQDLWPDSIIGSSMVSNGGVKKLVTSVLSRWLRGVYSSAAWVIGIAPTMVRTLQERGVSSERSSLLFNWGDDVVANDPVPDGAVSDRTVTRVLYAGNVGDMQDLTTVVRAAASVIDSGIEVTIVGDGVELDAVKDTARQLNATNVKFADRVPRHRMPEFYSNADFALVSLKDLPVFRGTIPSKFQASISHGLPVVTNVQGDLRQIVEEYGIGLTADAEDAESLASAFVQASRWDADQLEETRQRTREVYGKYFSEASALDELESILHRVSQE